MGSNIIQANQESADLYVDRYDEFPVDESGVANLWGPENSIVTPEKRLAECELKQTYGGA
jgi:hypothetical protein